MRRVLSFIFSFCLFLVLAVNCSAKEITILYTGDTHAMIYHCNCPMEPDGGVARRATLIKDLRKENPQALLLDSGGFFAGGVMDEYSQNTELDKQRTLVNLKSMELMKYDAAAVGDDEFSFGKGFFQDNINKTKLNFLSCNLKVDKILPFMIKDVSGVKIGIIGVTNMATRQKADGLEVGEPASAVEAAVTQARSNGADIIVLLSRLGESEDVNLINQVKGIDVVIIGKRSSKNEPASREGDTLILRPSWQGRRLGKVVIDIENKKVADFKVEDLRLSDKISDDKDILSVLPQCFSQANCKKPGFIGSCENPGSLSAKCLFEGANKIDLIVVTSRNCIACGDERTIESLKRQFPGLSVTYQYYPEKNAQKTISDLGLVGLPAYLFGKELEKDEKFEGFQDKLDTKGGYYLLKPKFGGLAYFLQREKINGKLDVFISLFDEKSGKTLETIKEFNPKIHFLVSEQSGYFDAAGGRPEIEDSLRAVCVQKYFPEAFWEYIQCRSKNIESSWWDDCLVKYNAEKIKTCSRGQEGALLLKENISLGKELQIMFGPTYLIDNQQIFTAQGAPSKEELRKIIKHEVKK